MRPYLLVVCLLCFAQILTSQTNISGVIIDDKSSETLIGATILIENSTTGTSTDFDGTFNLTTDQEAPFNVIISYTGYADQNISITSNNQELNVRMLEASFVADEIVVTGQRVSEEQKKAPLTIESLDLLAIKETPSDNFYDGLGALKGVDLTAASLGFKIINTRGFNSTSPVRSLQIIDGVDNQAPGLNFSLGNFLGSSELDVLKVDLIVGASGAFYGPNAFNGVIKMDTKNPFFQEGLSAYVKVGERNMLETAVRWADVFTNKNGKPFMAYKLNVSYLRADDWEAENYGPVVGTDAGLLNPGGFDGVNIYGDEYSTLNDQRTVNPWSDQKGLGLFHRQGYKEIDLVDYDTRNLKTNAAVHFRTQPNKEFESPELILSSSYSQGTTVYQGDNRFSLKDIRFNQNRIEYRKKDKYFVRGYMTSENAGNSYDPYFTALLLQQSSKSNLEYRTAYLNYWTNEIKPRIDESGYPQLTIEIDSMNNVITSFDYDQLENWTQENQDSLAFWHSLANEYANITHPSFEDNTSNFYEVGTERYNEEFARITSTKSGDPSGGSRIIDRSKLYHLHGEYTFNPEWLSFIKVGANGRLYTPISEGTIFHDTADVKITNYEFGFYTGVEKNYLNDKLTISATARLDKNQNFDFLVSPAASIVWNPSENNYLRLSFSSAVRNPTLSDQYLNFNVGPATLRGNLNGVDSLITLQSFDDYRRNGLLLDTLNYFNIDPIRPERVQSAEIGYRTTLFSQLFVDASYYYSIYNDFIGYQIGLDGTFDPLSGFPTSIRAYRYASNSDNTVTSQGFSIGLNYFFANYYKVGGNYSWNKLNTKLDDPIIPAFNTPEHKYNIGISGRNVPINVGSLQLTNIGFNVNYKWVEGFVFEGSPQFTGTIPSYGLLDAQLNWNYKKINTTFKLGASNVLNNKVYQTYGGPRIGRLAYFTVLYEFKKK